MVHYVRAGAAAVLTIDRPERRNAVDGKTAAALLDAFERFCADDDARVLVLTGAGAVAFCAAADLAQADGRRRVRLVPGRRPRARAVVRPADRHRGSRVRVR